MNAQSYPDESAPSTDSVPSLPSTSTQSDTVTRSITFSSEAYTVLETLANGRSITDTIRDAIALSIGCAVRPLPDSTMVKPTLAEPTFLNVVRGGPRRHT